MSFPPKVRDALIERQDGRCACGCGFDLVAALGMPAAWKRKYLPKGAKSPVEIDHIVPRSDGGTDDLDNLQALYVGCHRAKCTDERPGYRKPVQSPLLGVLPGRGQAITDDNRARRAAKGQRIGTARAGAGRAPVKRYARG